MINSPYLSKVVDINTLPMVVNELAKLIRKQKLDFDAIAFRGMSGALVVPMLCYKLEKGMIVCRKESEESHGSSCEGYMAGGNYIIVDDFISSGSTIRGVVKTIDDWAVKNTAGGVPFIPVGIFLYRDAGMEYSRTIINVDTHDYYAVTGREVDIFRINLR